MEDNVQACPNCGSLNTVRIIYGMPGYDLALLEKEGKIKLGGCMVTETNPDYYCNDCEHEWK